MFGGIGSIPGALLGGLLLGVIEIMAKAYISTQMSDAVVFAVLIIVLLVKPSGLLGEWELTPRNLQQAFAKLGKKNTAKKEG